MFQTILSPSLVCMIWVSMASAVDSTKYEARPLPLVNVSSNEPAAPAITKTEVCTIADSKSWADVSVAKIVAASRGQCAAPLKATADAAEAKTTR